MRRCWKWVCICLIMMSMISNPSTEKAAGADMRGKSTWLWNTMEIITQKEEIIDFFKSHHVDEVYLQVNPAVEKEYYHQFIEMANGENIHVYALDGAPKWATVKGQTSLSAFFDWLSAYQLEASETQRFTGVHLDVEPYLLTGWTTAYGKTVLNYQKMVNIAVDRSNSLQLPLGMDIPFWFDEKTYNNEFGKGNLAQWVIGQTEEVGIMAYRDLAIGGNGIIELVRNEMAFAQSAGKKVKVGVETAPSAEGNFLTFHEEGAAFMFDELAVVDAEYETNSSYKGIAVHHYGSWKELLE
ncbi:amidase [Rossellomorea sp. YZS02]|uniref:amidase n=1 Tax=Rossellomorea sp. YZS02 TaxID=3097358 RepID=UPI002A14FC25|nr:amidase [Rossellomorea sp. YZS02]MDX8342816.1 amidase [Rossellomorea sp. YZS02]